MGKRASVCFADGCDEKIGRRMLMCRDHWHRVPKAIRDAVYDGLDLKDRTGDRGPWAKAVMDAKQAVR